MVRRISDDDIEFHVENTLRLVGVDKGIGVAFQFGAAFVILLVGPAVPAATILPRVFHALETDVAFEAVEDFADRILSVGGLGAIHRPAREQSGQLRDSESVKLVREDVIDPLLAVGDLSFQSSVETLGDLA